MSEERRLPSGLALPPIPAAAQAGGITESGLFLPPGVGLDGLIGLPGAANDEVPTPPGDTPKDYAKHGCRYCHGAGEVKRDNPALRVTEVVLCSCVEKRLASRRGPRAKRAVKPKL